MRAQQYREFERAVRSHRRDIRIIDRAIMACLGAMGIMFIVGLAVMSAR